MKEHKMNRQLYDTLLLAYQAHKGQKDKANVDYINHPIYIALNMEAEEEKIVALLHDVIEDTQLTLEDLKAKGYSKQILDAIDCLTHKDNIPYDIYIKTIKNNSLATKVKIMDLNHNMDSSRLEHISEKDKKRLTKYKKALIYLEQ